MEERMQEQQNELLMYACKQHARKLGRNSARPNARKASSTTQESVEERLGGTRK